MTNEDNRELTWDAFVQGPAVQFFNANRMEKMTLDDGNGNKAKLTRLKDCGIRIESSSTTTL
jgi:flavin reductase (DIM6/NTAB) family NADH-FMN oxidoreductase RutF